MPEEWIQREQPPGGPRMESSGTEAILQLLRQVATDTRQLQAGHVSLFSNMAELKASVSQMYQWLDVAESRLSSLEDRASEMQASGWGLPQSHPRAQWILESERAQTEAEESDQQEDTFFGTSPQEYEPVSQPLTSMEEKAIQTFAAAWSQERSVKSETAQTEAVESDQQEDAFFGTSPQEYEPESSVSTFPESPEPPQLTPATAVEEEAPLGAKQLSGSDNRLSLQEPIMVTSPYHPGAVPGASSSSFSSHQMILDATPMAVPSGSVSGFTGGASMEPAAPSESRTESRSARSIEEMEVYKRLFKAWHQVTSLQSETAQEGPQTSASTFPESPELPQPTPLTAMEKEAPLGAKQLPRRVSPRKISHRTASTGTATSAAIPGPSASSKVMRPTKGQRTSIVWWYFTQPSKFWATCDICQDLVRTGNAGCNLGTSSLRQHLKKKHPRLLK